MISILLAQRAQAFVVKVGVEETLQAEVTSFYFNSTADLAVVKLEIRNRGSIAYSARTRIDLYSASNVSEVEEADEMFTAWSEEKQMMPGDRKNFELYWYNNRTTDIRDIIVRVRVYFANEISETFYEVEAEDMVITIRPAGVDRDTFAVKEFRVYDDFIIFDLVAKEDVGNVVVIPSSFTKGWIFEQASVRDMRTGTPRTAVIPYQTGVFAEDAMTLSFVSDDSRFHSEKTFTLKKNEGLTRLLFGLVDRLKLRLSRQL